MKDKIDKALQQHQAQPRKALGQDFTANVTRQLHEKPATGLRRLRTAFHWPRVRHLNKATMLAILGLIVVSGSAAAYTLWPRPTTTLTLHKNLPSGNQIVGIDTANCDYTGAVDSTQPMATGTKHVYYEIKRGSVLTDEQIRDGIQANCELNTDNNAVSAMVHKYHFDTVTGMQSTNVYTVNAITVNSITLTQDQHYDSKLYPSAQTNTYAVNGSTRIQNEGKPAQLSDIKLGDSVILVVQDTSGNIETADNTWQPLNHPETITVLGIIKVPALTASPDAVYRAFATEIVRVEPCSTSPTGFCRAYDFAD